MDLNHARLPIPPPGHCVYAIALLIQPTAGLTKLFGSWLNQQEQNYSMKFSVVYRVGVLSTPDNLALILLPV